MLGGCPPHTLRTTSKSSGKPMSTPCYKILSWIWTLTCSVTCSCSVYIRPQGSTTNGTCVPWTCHIALRLLPCQEFLGRKTISTKALDSILHSSIGVATVLAVVFATESDQIAYSHVLKCLIHNLLSPLLYWCVGWQHYIIVKQPIY